MGNLLAIQSAVDHPEKVSSLFMIDAPLIPRVSLSTVASILRITRGNLQPNTMAWNIAQVLGMNLPSKFCKYLPLLPRFWELFWECFRAKRALSRLVTPGISCQPITDELVHPKTLKLIKNTPSLQLVPLTSSCHFCYSAEDKVAMAQMLRQMLSDL